jgi:hypothetical protein
LFKIRATDGLLQRYLSDHGGRGTGMMQRYWAQGHNCNFVLLLSQVTEACYFRQIISDQDQAEDENDIGKAKSFFKPAKKFFETFSHDVNELWDVISNPFQRVSKKDFKDFIVDEYEEGSVDISGYRSFDAKSAIEEHAENKATAAYYDKFNGVEAEYEQSDDSSEYEIDNSELLFEELSEDGEDDWEQGILGKIETKLHGNRSGREAKHEKISKRRLSNRRERSASPVEVNDSKMIRDTSDSGQSRNKFVLMDSDDEAPALTASSAHSDDTVRKDDVLISSPTARRRLVIKESDEE